MVERRPDAFSLRRRFDAPVRPKGAVLKMRLFARQFRGLARPLNAYVGVIAWLRKAVLRLGRLEACP